MENASPWRQQHSTMANPVQTSSSTDSTSQRASFAQPTREAMSRSHLAAFMAHVGRKTGLSFATYNDFDRYCVDSFSAFWTEFMDWSGIAHEGDPLPASTSTVCEEAVFFPNVRLNYAENLLRLTDPAHAAERSAIVAVRSNGAVVRWSRGELRERTESLTRALSHLGLGVGDRVALVAYNTPEAIVGALAAAALGCTVSTLAPELGPTAMLARLQQIRPKLLMTDFSPAPGEEGDRLRLRVAEVAAELTDLQAVIGLEETSPLAKAAVPVHRASALCDERRAEPVPAWPQLPFNQPLFVLFSSGTTGIPKCIVHGAGGTLLEHVKEHQLHCDLHPDDRLFFQTSTGWMMWNWQLSALAQGTSIVLYDGPIQSPDVLWKIVVEHGVTVFGTSPGYIQLCERSGGNPTQGLDFSKLRAVLSTGSILSPRQQDWVSQHVKPLPIQSISGGTDIIGCFVLGNPILPAYAAEPQCRSLGLDVRALDPDGAQASGVGELVCANPFPSRPLGFLEDPERVRFHDAYFSQNDGFWTHGDLIEITPQGSFRMHGRSDGILNVKGIRIGPAEIYRILERVPAVAAAMVVEQDPGATRPESRLVLLVVLRAGFQLDASLQAAIRLELLQQGSPAHSPAVVLEVPELPTTWTGKPSERSARDVLNGRDAINAEALRNPASLEPLRAFVLADVAAVDQPVASAPPDATIQAISVAEMISLWSAVLHQTGLTPDSNFFDVGGDSLAALDLAMDVSSRAGHNVEMSAVFEAPTVKQFTSLVNKGINAASSLLVTLKEGDGPSPLYLVHGYGGSVMELRALAQSIDGNVPITGIRASGFEPDEPVFDRVEEMAAIYLAQIRSAQPEGPYHLAGYSAGGLIAVEMARQLLAEGARVSPVLLLDTTTHESHWTSKTWREFLFRRTIHHLRSLFQGPDVGPRFLETVRSLGGRLRSAFLGSVPRHDIVPSLGLTEQVRKLRHAGLRAYTRYVPVPIQVPIVLVRSELRFSSAADPATIWRDFAHGLEVIDTSGDHLSMIHPPHLSGLATAVSRVLTLPTLH